MKLSELFRTPFKLKGGSTLNLKGFSKRVIDKEVGEGGGGGGSDTKDTEKFIKKLLTFYGQTIIPETFSMFAVEPDGWIRVENIGDFESFYFLYAEDINIESFDKIATSFIIENDTVVITNTSTRNLVKHIIEIDDKKYAYLLSGMA